MRRYFIVNYEAVTVQNHIYKGILSLVMEDGSFINRKHTEKLIRDNTEGVDLTGATIVITGIMELSEDDYLDWYE